MPWGKRLKKRRLLEDISMEVPEEETPEEPEETPEEEPEPEEEPTPESSAHLRPKGKVYTKSQLGMAVNRAYDQGYEEALKIARLCTIAYGAKSGPAIMQYLKAGYSFTDVQEDIEEQRAAESDRADIKSNLLPNDGIEAAAPRRSGVTREERAEIYRMNGAAQFNPFDIRVNGRQ